MPADKPTEDYFLLNDATNSVEPCFYVNVCDNARASIPNSSENDNFEVLQTLTVYTEIISEQQNIETDTQSNLLSDESQLIQELGMD